MKPWADSHDELLRIMDCPETRGHAGSMQFTRSIDFTRCITIQDHVTLESNAHSTSYDPPEDQTTPAKSEYSKADRHNEICQLLHEKGHVSVTHLSKSLGVSEVTIRKDLTALEDTHIVVRTRGGAVLAEHFKFDLPFRKQLARHAKEKNAIGQAAAGCIEAHDTIVLGSGSTTAAIVPYLTDFVGLTVFTNSIRIANQLIEYEEIELLMPGGFLHKPTASIVGPYAEDMLRNHRFKKAFLGMDGCDDDNMITSASMLDAALQQMMIEVADRLFIVADASKFGRSSLNRVCHAEKVHRFITDARISHEARARLESAGAHVTAV